MGILYINTRGEAHRKHSYSAGLDWRHAPYKYYLKRVLGWKERDNKAYFLFGRAIEQAIEYFHNNEGQGLLEKFTELWTPTQEVKDLKYGKVEKDWDTLHHIGLDMLKLYIIKQPSLPIPLGGGSVFQRTYSKEVFPGDPTYGEILDEGKLDIITYVKPDHALLPKMEWKAEDGLLRPVIVDMKTSSKDLPERPGLVAFDKQLCRYSWQSGIPTVAFVWFVKKSLGYKKRSRVTLLTDVGAFKAGTEMFVAQAGKGDIRLVNSQTQIDEPPEIDNSITVKEKDFTHQRLQFNAGLVTPDLAEGAGIEAGQQIVEIVNAWNSKKYPKNFGIRYPHDDTKDPFFRAFVLNDEAYRDENFKLGDDDDLFEDDSIEETE